MLHEILQKNTRVNKTRDAQNIVTAAKVGVDYMRVGVLLIIRITWLKASAYKLTR